MGTRELMRSKSSMERGRRAALAMARRWSTAFAEPPVAATPAMAFSMAALVMILEGVTLLRRRSTTNPPARWPALALPALVAGKLDNPTGAMPKNLQTKAIQLAVDSPPPTPTPGD